MDAVSAYLRRPLRTLGEAMADRDLDERRAGHKADLAALGKAREAGYISARELMQRMLALRQKWGLRP